MGSSFLSHFFRVAFFSWLKIVLDGTMAKLYLGKKYIRFTAQ